MTRLYFSQTDDAFWGARSQTLSFLGALEAEEGLYLGVGRSQAGAGLQERGPGCVLREPCLWPLGAGGGQTQMLQNAGQGCPETFPWRS